MSLKQPLVSILAMQKQSSMQVLLCMGIGIRKGTKYMMNSPNNEKMKHLVGRHKKKIICSCILVGLILSGGTLTTIYGANNMGTSPTGSQSTNQYKEETVERNDIVVGVSEMGTANLQATSVMVDYDIEIDDMYVKSGQHVKAGDILADIKMVDTNNSQTDYEKEYNAKVSELEAAKLDLQQALLLAESQKFDAEYTLQSDTFMGENAESLYELSYEELENELENILEEIYTLEYEYEETEHELWEGFDGNKALTELLAQQKAIKTQIEVVNGEIQHVSSCNITSPITMDTMPLEEERSDTQQPEISSQPADIDNSNTPSCDQPNIDHDMDHLQETLTQLSDDNNQLQLQIDDLTSDNNEAMQQWQSQLENQLDNIEDSLRKLRPQKDEYVATLELQQLELGITYDENLYNYDVADVKYTNAIAQIENDIEQSENKISELEQELSDITLITQGETVVAPRDGLIMTISDDVITKANNNIISIANSEQVNILVNIPQEDIADIQIGMEASVVLDAYDDMVIPAVVDSISVTPASGMQTTVNYTVTILCDISTYQDMVVYEGMTSDVTFIQKQKKDVLIISNKCVITEEGKQYVKIKNELGEIEKVPVQTGFSDGFDVEIVDGLEEGDIVILESAVMTNAVK